MENPPPAGSPPVTTGNRLIIAVSSQFPYGVPVEWHPRKSKIPDRPSSARPVVEPVEARLLLAGGTLQGIAWDDLNADGVLQSGEPLLSNWTLYLDANHNARPDTGEATTLTGANGAYSFTNLAAGNYLIGSVLKSGWSQTYPSATNPAGAAPVAGAATPSAQSPDSVTASISRTTSQSQYTSTA